MRATLREQVWVLLIVVHACAWPASGQQERYLIIRYDDYAPFTHYASPRTPEFERRLFELVAGHRAKLVVGVIPFPIAAPQDGAGQPVDPARSSWLSRSDDPWVLLLREGIARGIIEPALHGFEHRLRAPPGYRPGEFTGQPRAWQRDAIRRGRDALATTIGTPVRVFVPPWNSWDAATVTALEELGFEWCSADFHHADTPTTRVRHLPQCTADPRAVTELIRAGRELPSGSIIVLVTHPFDFAGPEGGAYFHALDELLTSVDRSSDWLCVGMTDFPPAIAADVNQRFGWAVEWQRTQQAARDAWGPARWTAAPSTACRPVPWYRSHLPPWQFALAGTCLVSVGAATVATWALARWVLRSRAAALLALLLVAVGLLALVHGAWMISRHGYHVRGVRWQAICLASGATAGLLISGLRKTPRPTAADPTPRCPRSSC